MKVSTVTKSALFAAALTLSPAALAQDEVTIKIEKLSDTISVLFGQGGNIGVSAGEDGVFIIDDQFAPLSDKIKAAIATLSDKPVNYVINTHWHYDHTGGNENFGKTGSVIIAHDNIRKRMESGGTLMPSGKVVPPAPAVALPVITFNDSMSLHLNGEEARLIHVKSSHTDGDGIVFFKGSNIVHMGDTFFYTMYPYVDHSSGGSIKGIIKATKKVLANVDDETQIIPGHGPVTDKAGLASYLHMCVAMSKRIAEMKKSGMSKEDVIAAKPTSAFDKKWDTWAEGWKNNFVAALYDEAK